jgi:lactoylglutathione lyase
MAGIAATPSFANFAQSDERNTGNILSRIPAKLCAPAPDRRSIKGENMQLGNFSVSLAVKDIAVSQAFYEKLGFKFFAGDAAQNWLILKNGDHAIGLFQGMFDKNMMTFNPGWDSNANSLADFTDVRELQRQLKAQGVQLETEADETTKGPGFFMVLDPDGNPVLFDQHV